MHPLKSKKIISLIVIGLLLIIASLWWVGGEKNEAVTPNNLEELTASTTFSAKLGKLIVERIQSEGGIDEFNQSELPKDYSQDSLKTVPATKANRETYAKSLISVLKPFSREREHESNVALRLLNVNDVYDVKALEQSRSEYRALAIDLLAMPVPTDAISYHLKLTNLAQRQASLLDNMQTIRTEPLVGLNAAYGYGLELDNFYQTINQLNNYFASHKINLTAGRGLDIFVIE